MDKKLIKAACEAHLHRYVEARMADGNSYDGIVEYVDDEWVCMAVPGTVGDPRGFAPPPYPPFPPIPPYPPIGPFGPFRPRRFNRLVLPLAGFAALSLLPYYW